MKYQILIALFILVGCGNKEFSGTLGKCIYNQHCSNFSYSATGAPDPGGIAMGEAKRICGGDFTEGAQCDTGSAIGFCKHKTMSVSSSDGKSLTLFHVTVFPSTYNEKSARLACGVDNYSQTYP